MADDAAEKEITHQWLPDISLITGREWMCGDSFQSLPQNGNDAASVLDKRWKEQRYAEYLKAFPNAIDEMMLKKFLTLCS